MNDFFVFSLKSPLINIWIMCAGIIAILGVLGGTFALYKHYQTQKHQSSFLYKLYLFLFQILKYPLLALSGAFIALAICYTLELISLSFDYQINYALAFSIILPLIGAWIFFNILMLSKQYLLAWATEGPPTSVKIILPFIANSLTAAFGLLAINILFSFLTLPDSLALFLPQVLRILFILTLAWIAIQAINAFERYVLHHYINSNQNILAARKINTQMLILKRIVMMAVILLALAAILMNFSSVKHLGEGLLTTAGIVTAIITFASKESLGKIVGGLQLAFTQPVRIGDSVIIDKEFGEVEEITLSYIVIKLWDLRRLILPSDYFIKNSLQNLTRDSTQLIGSIILYADFSLPIQPVREKFFELLSQSPLWDKQIRGFDVTDLKETSMELRALMSAKNSGDLWGLRCEIREKLVEFIMEYYPEAFSRMRTKVLEKKSTPMQLLNSQ